MSHRLLALIGIGMTLALPAAGQVASAAECHATGGQREGQEAWTVRHLTLADDRLVVTGHFRERYVLSCSLLSQGLLCRGIDGELEIVVLANGVHMLESVADRRTGREQLAHSYVCDHPVERSADGPAEPRARPTTAGNAY